MMDYNIEPSKDLAYIVIKIIGDFVGKQMLGCIIEAHALGQELGINLYLVDVTHAKNIDSIMKKYEFAYSDMKNVEGIDLSARVAALRSPGDHSHDFIETVLSNAGLPIKIFDDPTSARDYLLKDPADSASLPS
jgi:hypothetical protein